MKVFLKTTMLLFITCLSLFACSKDDDTKLSPAQFSINQSTVDFGEVEVSTPKEVKLTITNTGEEDLVLKDYVLSGSNASVFTVNAAETEKTVEAGKTYEFLAIFKPVETGDRTALLTITSNVGEHKVTLSGKGTPEPVAVFNINPESKDFGDVMLENEAILNFTITNTGNAELVISETTLGGANAGAYTTTNNSVTISSNGATGVKVTFAPQTTGNKTATLSIVTNVGTYTVNLEGNGIPDPNATVNIPDANFKASLLAHGITIKGDDISKIDTNNDGEIQVSEAEVYSGTINCQDKNIKSFTGIEAFLNITVLYAGNNTSYSIDLSNNTKLEHLSIFFDGAGFLKALDLSNNAALTYVNCSGNNINNLSISNSTNLSTLNCGRNELVSLDISNNKELKVLQCNSNMLTDLDVSNSPLLETLDCNNNNLTTLDISKNIALSELKCYSNKLSSLDCTNNLGLTNLICNDNQLTSINLLNNASLRYLYCNTNKLTLLDISKNTELYTLRCDNNQLASLNLSNNESLNYIDCSYNQITSLDISNTYYVKRLMCYSNQLTYLNVANGNSHFIETLDAYNNNLTCIQIDSGITPSDNWKIDNTVSYSTTGCP